MRAIFFVLIVLGSFVFSGMSHAQVGRLTVTADGLSKGAVCVDDTHLKSKSGRVVECPYDCFPLQGGAVCRDCPCDYVICNDPPGSYCSNPEGPEPGLLYTTSNGGVCDPTGEQTGAPGECYYPDIVINCGSAEACVFVGHGRDFCRVVPPKRNRR